MDNKKTGYDGIVGEEKSKLTTSSSSKNATTADRRARIYRTQNVLLIWLDQNIDVEHNDDCRNTITHLRHVVNSINTFTNGDECIEFLNSIDNEKVCMIISGSFGQNLVPIMHNMFQIDSIFIFCRNRKRHEQWTKDWPKIKGVFTKISPICKAIKEATQQCEHNSISLSFVSRNESAANKKLDHLDPSFMYTKILKEILLDIRFNEQNIKQFTNFCRERFAENQHELHNIDKFEQTYHDETPIWWYSYDCFLYPLLNRALRLMEVDIIINIGFFIDDLHRHIAKLHREQFGGHHTTHIFTVYRGQGLSKADFEQMIKAKGGLMSFNNFLSTSKNRNVSLGFARDVLINPDLIGIFFVMTIDSSIVSSPFASITAFSYYKDVEDEILFSMHTIFRIREIKSMDENDRLWQVELTLTNDNDPELRALAECLQEELTECIRDEIQRSTGWSRLGLFLLGMKQIEKAEQIFEMMLDQAPSEGELAVIYHGLGIAKANQGKFTDAIVFNEKALRIRQKTLSPNHLHLANSYRNIGSLYLNMGEYSTALSYFKKALEIQQKAVPPNPRNLATLYNCHGLTYCAMGEHLTALSYFERALEIQQNSLPPNHPDLAGSYRNIGLVYFNLGECSKAISYYEKVLEVQQKSLPPNDPDFAETYYNIGMIYDKIDHYSNALSYYEKGLEVQQKCLPPNHPDLAMSYNNIGWMYQKMNQHVKALSYYERAVDIAQRSLPLDHPDFQLYRNNLDNVKQKL